MVGNYGGGVGGRIIIIINSTLMITQSFILMSILRLLFSSPLGQFSRVDFKINSIWSRLETPPPPPTHTPSIKWLPVTPSTDATILGSGSPLNCLDSSD